MKPELDTNEAADFARLARRGISALMVRQVIVQVFTFSGGIVLARVLSPAEFGLFGIAAFLVNAIGMFGDFGLAPSFIQRRDELTQHDLQVGFTVQQVLVGVVVIVLWLIAPSLVSLYPHAPHQTLWLVRAIAFSLFLTSWRSMSALQLERALDYQRLAWVEATQAVGFQAVAVSLVLCGLGVWSLVWATMARGVLGTALVYALRPWRVRFAWDKQIVSSILRYGIPFQAARILNSLTGWVTPVLVGVLIGPAGVGFITWAASNGRKPLMLVENVARVSFSHFSRLQTDWETLHKTMVRYLTYLLLPSLLWGAVIWAAGYPIVHWIYTAKWLPAVPTLMLYGLLLNLNVIDWVTGMTLNAVGLVGRAAKSQLLRTLVMLGTSVPLVLLVGINGVPIAEMIALSTMLVWMLLSLRSDALHQTIRPLLWMLVPSAGAALVGHFFVGVTNSHPFAAIAPAMATVAVYLVLGWFFAPRWLRRSVRNRMTRAPEAIRGGMSP